MYLVYDLLKKMKLKKNGGGKSDKNEGKARPDQSELRYSAKYRKFLEVFTISVHLFYKKLKYLCGPKSFFSFAHFLGQNWVKIS